MSLGIATLFLDFDETKKSVRELVRLKREVLSG